MASVGGDITEVTYNHPTLGAGRFLCKANEDSTFDKGGFRRVDDQNMVDGAGEDIAQINRVRWSFEGTVTWDNLSDPDALDRLKSLASDPVPADWTFSHISGKAYGGKGAPVGDIQAGGNNATISMKIAGGGTLETI